MHLRGRKSIGCNEISGSPAHFKRHWTPDPSSSLSSSSSPLPSSSSLSLSLSLPSSSSLSLSLSLPSSSLHCRQDRPSPSAHNHHHGIVTFFRSTDYWVSHSVFNNIHTRIGLSKYLKFIILVVSIILDKYATIPNISIVELKLLFKEGSFHLSLKS